MFRQPAAHSGADQLRLLALAALHLLPEIVRHDAQLRMRHDHPLILWAQDVLTITGLELFPAPPAIPDIASNVHLVVENAASESAIAVNGRGEPFSILPA